MARIIVINSGKGGVGKTTTAINLGAALNMLDKEVVIVDANLNTPNVGLQLGAPIVPVTLNHVLKGKATIEEAIYEHSSGTKIIPSSLSVKELTKFNTKKIPEIVKQLREVCDFVIFDSAAGFGEEVMAVLGVADEIIIVTNPEMPAITDALKTIKIAEKLKKNVLGVIMTKVKKNKIEMQPETVKDMLEIPILGMIPDDISISEALNYKDAVVHTHPKSMSSRAYKEIASNLLGVDYNSDKDKESIIRRIMNKFHLK